VALGRGGALETVIDGETGVLYGAGATHASPLQEVDALAAALGRVARLDFDRGRIRAHAEQFSRDRHEHAMRAVIDETIAAPAGARW
jgi:hypothetical protein